MQETQPNISLSDDVLQIGSCPLKTRWKMRVSSIENSKKFSRSFEKKDELKNCKKKSLPISFLGDIVLYGIRNE